MPTTNKPGVNDDGIQGSDAPIPKASEDEVLEDTARLAREGRHELETDPKEPHQRSPE